MNLDDYDFDSRWDLFKSKVGDRRFYINVKNNRIRIMNDTFEKGSYGHLALASLLESIPIEIFDIWRSAELIIKVSNDPVPRGRYSDAPYGRFQIKHIKEKACQS